MASRKMGEFANIGDLCQQDKHWEKRQYWLQVSMPTLLALTMNTFSQDSQINAFYFALKTWKASGVCNHFLSNSATCPEMNPFLFQASVLQGKRVLLLQTIRAYSLRRKQRRNRKWYKPPLFENRADVGEFRLATWIFRHQFIWIAYCDLQLCAVLAVFSKLQTYQYSADK